MKSLIFVTVLLAAAGCASTTEGAGTVGSRAVTSAHPTDFPSSGSTAPTPPETTGAPSPTVTPVSPPKECAKASDCKVVKSFDLGKHVVAVLSAPSASGGVGSSIIALALGDQPVDYHVFDGETPGELLCTLALQLANCALVNYVGAHAATVYPIVVRDDKLVIGPSVGSDTPGLHVGDLNGDQLVDAWGLQNNYKPDYASGHVQWQTWQRSADGHSFTSTGCTALTPGDAAQPAPKALVTGPCDAG